MGSQGHLSSGQLGADYPGGMSVHGEGLLVQASLPKPPKLRPPLRAKGEAASVVGKEFFLSTCGKSEALLAVGIMGSAAVRSGDRPLRPAQEDLLFWAGFPWGTHLFHRSRLYLLVVH